MSKVILKDEYATLTASPSVQNWLNALSSSKATRQAALYSLYRFSQYTGKDAEKLLADKEAELGRERRLRYETEDKLRAFATNVKGAHVYAAYLKSYYKANHLPLDLKLVRPPPQREAVALPDDAKLRALVEASGSKQLKALLMFLVESGARIGSVLQLQYRHVKEDYEAGVLPCKIAFPARITKGNIRYVGFIGEDAVKSLADYLNWRTHDRLTKDVHGRRYTLKGIPVTDES